MPGHRLRSIIDARDQPSATSPGLRGGPLPQARPRPRRPLLSSPSTPGHAGPRRFRPTVGAGPDPRRLRRSTCAYSRRPLHRQAMPPPAKDSRGMTAILLVHGAWHGPWCWDDFAARLSERAARRPHCSIARPRSATGPNLAPGAQLRRRSGTRSGRFPGPPGRRRTLIGRPGDAEVPGARCGPSGGAHGLDPAGRNDGVDGATGRPAPAELRQGEPSDDLATGC